MPSICTPVTLTLLFALSTCPVELSSLLPVVHTSNGDIQGYFDTVEKHPYTYFYGIPYAVPPVGLKRFSVPEPSLPWSGTLEASKYKPACVQQQQTLNNLITSEDCLYLNVFRPVSDDQHLPVLVYIHGGGFVNGAPVMYPVGQISATTNSVVVTVAYRLDFFGFYYASDNKQNENVGLQDQALAIKWVYDNIKAFGGDPSTLTIFGESAGGMSVLIQSVLPKAIQNTPIHAIIAESPGPWKLPNTTMNAEDAMRVGSALNCPNTIPLTTCLRNRTSDDIVNTVETLKLYTFPVAGGSTLPSQPLALFKSGEYNKVPMIIGTNEYEGNLFVVFATGTTPSQGLNEEDFHKQVNIDLKQYSEGFISNVTQLYDSYTSSHGYWEGASKIFGDIAISCGSHLASEVISKQQNSLWRYHFTRVAEGPNSYLNATHMTELSYVFQHEHLFLNYTFDEDDYNLASVMVEYWKNMAKNGSPNKGEIPWSPFSDDREVIEFDVPLKMTNLKQNIWDYCNFWDTVLSTLDYE